MFSERSIRDGQAEALLVGTPASEAQFQAFADAVLRHARPSP